MKNTAQGISPDGRVSSNEEIKILNSWSFQLGNKFIMIELFNKKVMIKNKKSHNEVSIPIGMMLITILTLNSIGDL